jgi:hypothetical protein
LGSPRRPRRWSRYCRAYAESLWNERGFFESYFGLVEAWRGAPDSARLIAVAGTIAAEEYKSVAAEPYKKTVLGWTRDAPADSALGRLAPAIFKRLGEGERLARWLSSAPRVADAAYARWIERVTRGE